ncbi:hypothetical protein HYALB_00012106 [Hymenoscyphus albidus]|uniref:Uncharacterized protein n=1 Tax=Hymenoscyphus albidus TaxID=595503 RepID=A0A9N9PTK8_9HELO|nr:hypothetical protein HYALB_00012106 [Hymenoscyphus albidus]
MVVKAIKRASRFSAPAELFSRGGVVLEKTIIWLPDVWVYLMRKHRYVTRQLTCEIWPYNAPNIKPRRARKWTKQIFTTADDGVGTVRVPQLPLKAWWGNGAC